MLSALADRYPISHRLEDGASVTCSLMTPADQDALSKFLSRLQPRDLLYLQFDIRKPEVQDAWFTSIEAGKSVCLCAYDPAQLVGYASVQISGDDAKRDGEVRVNLTQGYRSRGLGRILTAEIFEIANRLNLESLTARMLADQHGARAAFEKIGFTRERVLENYVELPNGEPRDLLVMSRSL